MNSIDFLKHIFDVFTPFIGIAFFDLSEFIHADIRIILYSIELQKLDPLTLEIPKHTMGVY